MSDIREISGYPGYGISLEKGTAKAWTKRTNQKGRFSSEWSPKAIRLNKEGYLYVKLIDEDGMSHNASIHKIILEVFVGPCPDGHLACHLNYDKQDNRLENLAWVDFYQHKQDRDAKKKYARGEKMGSAKLTESQVREILALRKSGFSMQHIGNMYGVCHMSISRIYSGHHWSHIK